jgi:hypothetical protein
MADKGTPFLDEVNPEGSPQATKCQQTDSVNVMPQTLTFSQHHQPLLARSKQRDVCGHCEGQRVWNVRCKKGLLARVLLECEDLCSLTGLLCTRCTSPRRSALERTK